jgi:CheY-like chemotaxis protein
MRDPRSETPPPLVLVVDDNGDLRDLYATYFLTAGFRVDTASDGISGLALARLDAPDVIVADLSMPHLDGWEMTRRLKNDPRTSRIPIVAVTGRTFGGSAERALDAGCDAYVLKPCLPDALLREARRLLGGGVQRRRSA